MNLDVNRLWSWRAVTQGAVRALCIVVPAPAVAEHLGFQHGIKDFAVEQLVTKFPVERFDVSVFPGAAWFDEEGLHVE